MWGTEWSRGCTFTKEAILGLNKTIPLLIETFHLLPLPYALQRRICDLGKKMESRLPFLVLSSCPIAFLFLLPARGQQDLSPHTLLTLEGLKFLSVGPLSCLSFGSLPQIPPEGLLQREQLFCFFLKSRLLHSSFFPFHHIPRNIVSAKCCIQKNPGYTQRC